MTIKAVKNRNYVAKYAQTSGAGKHEQKRGTTNVSRAKQKKQWRQEAREFINY